MIAVKKVGEFYYEFWLEEAERKLMQRIFALPQNDQCIIVVTVVNKGLDSRELSTKFQAERAADDESYEFNFECHDEDHT